MQQSFGPRERMQYDSVNALSDTELVMALLGTGTARRGVASVARSVVRRLLKYQPVTFDGLMSIEGIGPAAAGRIMAAFALAARFRHQVPLAQRWKVIPPVEGLCYAQISFLDEHAKELSSFVRASSSLDRLITECLRAAGESAVRVIQVNTASHGDTFIGLLRQSAPNHLRIIAKSENVG